MSFCIQIVFKRSSYFVLEFCNFGLFLSQMVNSFNRIALEPSIFQCI